MAAVDEALVAAVVRFAAARVRELAEESLGLAPNEIEQQPAAVAAKLSALLARNVVVAGEVREHLLQARTQLGLLVQQVDPLVDPTLAVGTLVAVLDHVRAAALAAGAPAASLELLLAPISGHAVQASGIPAQLGLPAVPAPDGLTFEPVTRKLTYRLTRAGDRSLAAGFPLQVGATDLEATLVVNPAEPPRIVARLVLRDVRLPVVPANLGALLGGAGRTSVELVVSVDTTAGLTVGGGARTAVSLPPPPRLGSFLDVKDLRLARAEDGSGVEIVADIASKLGGVVGALLHATGVAVGISPGAATPLAPRPRMPSGIRLSFDGGVVRGGGFLGHRERAGVSEFFGVLDLTLGPVGVEAAGILTLGGDTGFALIVVMGIRFNPAIELSFGFTLNAVGGIVGIQHVIDVDALAAGLSSGAIGNILFPENPEDAAPAIIATLGSVFPRRRGGAVFGPMVQLGWGRPISFVTATLGLVVSVPDPKVVVLGRFRVAVPAPDVPIIDIRADVFGEFSEDRVLIRGSLQGSRLGGFSVSGDAGILVRYGSSPDMAISAGGFHPGYRPPPELADMSRIQLDLSPPVGLKLRTAAYAALTTNSFQAGGRIDFGYNAEVASAEGFLALDVLVVWAPAFHFEVDLSAGVTVRVAGFTIGGISLSLHLEGPAPWRASGTARVDLPWPVPDVPIDVGPIEWGDHHNPPPVPAHPRDEIVKQLRRPEAWLAQLPARGAGVVRLRDVPGEADVVVHPLGRFEIRQHAAPLDRVVTRMGASPVAESERKATLTVPAVNGVPAGAVSPVEDLFAPGSFFDLTDDEKLTRRAFEPMPAGVRVEPSGAAAIPAGEAQVRVLQYETFVIGVDGRQARSGPRSRIRFSADAAVAALRASAAGSSTLRANQRYEVEPTPIALADPAAVRVVGVRDLASAAVAPDVLTDSEARLLLGPGLQLARLGVAP